MTSKFCPQSRVKYSDSIAQAVSVSSMVRLAGLFVGACSWSGEGESAAGDIFSEIAPVPVPVVLHVVGSVAVEAMLQVM